MRDILYRGNHIHNYTGEGGEGGEAGGGSDRQSLIPPPPLDSPPLRPPPQTKYRRSPRAPTDTHGKSIV